MEQRLQKYSLSSPGQDQGLETIPQVATGYYEDPGQRTKTAEQLAGKNTEIKMTKI